MRKLNSVFLSMPIAFVFCACQSNLSFRKSLLKKQSFMDPARLDPDAKMALKTREVAKFKYLKPFPFFPITNTANACGGGGGGSSPYTLNIYICFFKG